MSAATQIISLPEGLAALKASDPFYARVKHRTMNMNEFVETCGSGTLRRNTRIGYNVASQKLHERAAWEFGWAFEVVPERCVTWGQPRSEGDCHPVTESGWFADRYNQVSLFPGDETEVKYLHVESEGVKREGIGLVIRKTSAAWVPVGYMVFAIIAEYDQKTHDFLPATNPC